MVGITTAWETVFKGGSVRKVENLWSKFLDPEARRLRIVEQRRLLAHLDMLRFAESIIF